MVAYSSSWRWLGDFLGDGEGTSSQAVLGEGGVVGLKVGQEVLSAGPMLFQEPDLLINSHGTQY